MGEHITDEMTVTALRCGTDKHLTHCDDYYGSVIRNEATQIYQGSLDCYRNHAATANAIRTIPNRATETVICARFGYVTANIV